MERKPQPGWDIYKEEMDFLCFGHALWEPAPTAGYARIRVGDVGFIRRGQFHLLFSAGSSPEGQDVPATFEQLNVGTPVTRQPRQPGCLCTNTVRQVEAAVSATVSGIPPLEAGAGFSYELTQDRGAALVTKHRTHRMDALVESAFKRYTKRHYDSWVTFACDKDYGDNVRPVLVSGFDMTKDFAMVAYSDDSTSSGPHFTITVPNLASASASIWGTWKTKCSPHTNCGPQEGDPPPCERATEVSSSRSVAVGSIPDGFNQCVFIRYYTMRPRKFLGIFPRVIRAGAGPHDLGSGDNEGDTFPELIVQPYDEYDNGYDSWDIIADYIFQNSNAVSALMHYGDVVWIRTAGGADDLPTLLAMHKPRIAVDENGDWQGIQQPEATVEGSNTPTFLNPRSTTGVHPSPFTPRNGSAGLLYSRSSQDTAIPTETEASSLSGLGILTAQLDGLNADMDPEDLAGVLNSAFAEDELYQRYISSVLDDEARAKALLEVFDKALTVPQHDTQILKESRKLCGRVGFLPASHIIPSTLTQMTERPVSSGTFGDLGEGVYDGNKVAIKGLRVYKDDDVRRVRKVFCKEVGMLKRFSHPNIVPFLGFTEAPAPISMVYEWMPNGNVRECIAKNPKISRLQLLLDISRGLSFLHSLDIVHGDLKGGNVLVDKSGFARLNDFGLASIFSPKFEDSYRWMAPELFGVEENESKSGTPTPESDVFALGMVAVEVFTGQVPFPDDSPLMAMKKIVEGEQPLQPPKRQRLGLSYELWALIQSSWSPEVDDRPSVSTFVSFLEGANPDIALLGELMGLDVESEEHISKLERLFRHGEESLAGMREDESLILIEVFDRVHFTVFDIALLLRFLLVMVLGSELCTQGKRNPLCSGTL
ncbi:hypothetical protein BJ322DRAFT_279145 [Thelephora terrestris]|uniref:Protein kinase domain-containing protein n=1 Tax=Thelephora terrestris TaxID=56493 RepID=A0A9P6L3L3_9AGAM|nr:hypothetical protein BJ322DRAFT_279145 [Thelephora terrestris]